MHGLKRRDVLLGGAAALGSVGLATTWAKAEGITPGKPFSGTKISILSQPSPPEAKAMLPAFLEATGIEAEWNEIPFADLQTRYATILAGEDAAFDVLYSWDGLSPLYGASLFDDLTGRLDPEVIADIPASAIAAHTIDGALRAAPFSLLIYILYYNGELFEKAGLDPASPPETWEAMFEATPRLTEAVRSSAGPDAHVWLNPLGNPNLVFNQWGIFLNGANGRMYSDDFRKVAFNGPEGLKAMQTFYDAAVTHQLLDPAGWSITTNEETHQAYSQGLTVIQSNPGRYYKVFNENPESSTIVGKTRLGLMPGITVRSGTTSGNIGYAINRFSTKKDAAAEFLKFFTDATQQLDMGLNTSQVPVRASVLAEPAVTASNPTAAITAEQATYPSARFGSPVFFDIAAVFGTHMHTLATTNTLTVEQTLDMCAADCQEVLDQYWA